MIGRSVVRLRARTKTSPYSHGPNASGTEDWTSPEEQVLSGVAIAPTSSIVKYIDIGSPIATGITLLFPERSDLDITARDRFRIDGVIWRAAGEPEVYVSPFTGWVGGTAIKLIRQENV